MVAFLVEVGARERMLLEPPLRQFQAQQAVIRREAQGRQGFGGARALEQGGEAQQCRQPSHRLAQAFGRLIRRQGDCGLFVILSAAMPSRLLSAFPPGVAVNRVPLDVAIARVQGRLGGELRQRAIEETVE